MNDFDVIVLGGGSAGSAAAAAAAATGARTAMINDGELGGLCILRGCMPTKSMLEAAHALHHTHPDYLKPFGVVSDGPARPDYARIIQRKNEHVARFKRAKVASIENQDYELIEGFGAFESGGGVRVGDRVLKASGYVIATGSLPTRIAIPGVEDVPTWTSDDMMHSDRQPRRLLVQGAGAIGLELAQFFARVGTEVTVVNRSPLLARSDFDCGQALKRILNREENLSVRAPARIVELKRDGDGLEAHIEGEDGHELTVHADRLLLATGRHPHIEGLGLEHAGLTMRGGHIEHDSNLRTANPDVFVAGDSTGHCQILHLANQEGAIAGFNAAGGTPVREMDYRLAMSVIFTDPPFADIGLGVTAAQLDQRPIIVGHAEFPQTGRAITMEVQEGTWKLIADPDDGEILGAAILGPRADDLVHLISLLMHYRARASDILEQPWYHPTLSEVILTLARDVESQVRPIAG